MIIGTQAGYTTVVRALLRGGASPEGAHNSGSTALHAAVARQRLDVARLLIEHGANLSAVALDGKAAVHVAVEAGSVAALQLLLNARASATVRDRERGMASPLELACMRGSAESIKALLKAGCSDPDP